MHAVKRHYYTGRPKAVNTAWSYTRQVNAVREFNFLILYVHGKPQHDDKGFVDSGCSKHMTGNIAYLLDFKEFNGGYVAFGGGAYGGRITGTSDKSSQDCIVMPIWKDTSYFDSPTKDVDNGEPICSKAGRRIEPTSIAKALSDLFWVKAILKVHTKEDGIILSVRINSQLRFLKNLPTTDVKSSSTPVNFGKAFGVKDGDVMMLIETSL
ncbi:hypothetical protein Tco_1054086 [Tanacetum coccineum]|uniref:Uncharacterized protein n=1 Tax=Tanacetum coccineum TaxID=301880 RepID=A0ABQ5GWP3_9ASTR